MELAGQRFGRWTVIRRADRKLYWFCRCDCGTEKDVAHGSLRSGQSLSCGCYLAERTGERSVKHGHTRNRKLSPTYHAWRHMHDACFVPSSPRYPKIGGLGIGIEPVWMEFAAFLRDMGEKPPRGTLGRHDEVRDFGPTNCFWRKSWAQPGSSADAAVTET